MSKSLVTLLDNSLLPASVMIFSKFVGVVLAIKIFNIPWSIKEYASSIFSIGTIVKPEDLTTVTSYSDLVMFSVLILFFTFTVIRAVYFHSSHVKPTLILSLSNKNLLSLVRDSYEIYHNAAIWLIFMGIANALILINVVFGRTYLWIGIASVVSTIILTGILMQDIYKEIENIKKHPGQYKWQ